MARVNLRNAYDFYLEVARGNIPGYSTVLIRGHNPTQTSASGFVDIAEFGDLTYLTTAETMDITSDSTSDTSDGVGLRTLRIDGVDNTGAAVQEIIIMNGTDDVVTANSYLRVNTLVGLTAGSSGWNVGIVTATASTAATIQAEMGPTESLSQASHYTVPLGKTFLLKQVEFNAAKASGGGSPEIEFKGYIRIGGAGAAWIQAFDKKMDTGVDDEIDIILPFPTALVARTDIRLRADTDTNSTEVRTRMYGVLVEN